MSAKKTTEKAAHIESMDICNTSIESLRESNTHLSKQIKNLLQTKHDLGVTQTKLENQVNIYAKLHEFSSQPYVTEGIEKLFNQSIQFVIYELGFERCLIFSRSEQEKVLTVHSVDGFYDNEELTLIKNIEIQPGTKLHSKLNANIHSIAYDESINDDVLNDFSDMLKLKEYIVFKEKSDQNQLECVLIAGNSGVNLEYYSRVSNSTEISVGLANLFSSIKTIFKNIKLYEATNIGKQKLKDRTIELEAAMNKANEANQAKTQFLANMSHEIRTPMNGVLGMLQRLRKTPINDKQSQYVDMIYDSAESLLLLIDDILNFSKLETGLFVLENIEFNLYNELNSWTEFLNEAARNKGVALALLFDNTISEKIIGDPTRLRQIFNNLVNNAIKFTNSGGQVVVSVNKVKKNIKCAICKV